MTTPKSEVRVTLSCKAIQTINRFLYFAPAALFEEDPAWKEIERAFRNTQKSEVRVTLTLEDAKLLHEAMCLLYALNNGRKDLTKEAQAAANLWHAIRKAQPRPEPTDEEKQAMIYQ